MLRFAITPGELPFGHRSSNADALVERCASLARAGVDVLLVREKHLAAGDLVRLCRRIAGVAKPARVLVSGRVDVALAAGLAGVHLSSAPGELTPEQVRRLMPAAYVSVSCHTVEEMLRARSAGASAALFAPVFGKWVDESEVVAGVGLERLREACAAAKGLPVLALGGVTAANAPACLQAGAAGVAGIRLFFSPGNQAGLA